MSITVTDATIRWVRLRDESEALREKRGQFECVNEGAPFAAANHQAKPCWKNYLEIGRAPADDPGNVERDLAPESEWCEPCRQRQRVHEQLRKVTASRGAALRVLVKVARDAADGEARGDLRSDILLTRIA